jgi:transcriptional regulator with XRE-family HTH domain
MPARATSIRRTGPGHARAQDIDRHVGARIRERRNMLRLMQEELAKLIGVTKQQVHKYEQGINRIAAGHLHQIAQALDVEVGYFFEGVEIERTVRPNPQQPRLLELARNFIALPSRRHQEAICLLARALANAD